jgi:uncharacterized protein (DUF1697 family)
VALVVLLKGVNVGGYRNFRPSNLAKELKRYEVVNIGAAGTFVVRKPITRTKLRAEIARRLPFEADVMICDGSDILRLVSGGPFATQPTDRSIIQFVSVLAKRRKSSTKFPLNFPPAGDWTLKVLGHQGQFVYGMFRREMKAIASLDQLRKIFGAPATTRSWTTILTIARILKREQKT